MSVELVIEPGRVVTWEVFELESAQRDKGTIGLDGYVYGRPRFGQVTNYSGEVLGVQNFNHHEEVSRLGTLATCGQVEVALVSGLREGFNDENGRFDAIAVVNDCDQDVCLSCWQLDHISLVEKGTNPAIGRLIRVASLLDMTAGNYPFSKDLEFLEVLNWINDPYNRARANGDAASADPEVHRSVIEAVGRRIDRYVMGEAGKKPLEYGFETVDKNSSWIMIREEGAQAKRGAIDQGNSVIISLRDQDPERVHVSFCRRSEWVDSDFPRIIQALNVAELAKLKELGLVSVDVECLDPNLAWGGGDTTFGSPRGPGTKLDLMTIGQIADQYTRVG